MGTQRRPEKRKLSKSILEMKFMKKSKEKAYQEEEEEEGRAVFSSEVTEAMKKGANKFIIEPSFVPCEGLIVGRLSYNGMNPLIERLMEKERQPIVKIEKPDVDVSDAEMAERYGSLVGTMSKKFQSKANRQKSDSPARKKAKFMKPSEDD